MNLDIAFAGLLSDCKKKGLLKSEKVQGFNGQKKEIRFVESARTFKPTALILIKHSYLCQCGEHFNAPNTTLLREMKNARGERKLEQRILPSDLKELPRIIEEMEYNVEVCTECFAGEDLSHIIKNQKDNLNPADELESLL